MMDEAEKRFREAARQMDELLGVEEDLIKARGVAVVDESSRIRHYKNEYLSWRYRFETKRARGVELEKVSVIVSLSEHDAATLLVWRRAEIFQLGQVSRWQSTTERSLPLTEVLREGLLSVVLEAIRDGEAAAAEVA